ncbi:ABC transporter-like protein [Corchorus olitorius]|uniref:ABC-type xenobiotic transporter n=1 Tax=Corchorus olitorius TaxID=93759 RepID=A0A1R3H8W7_9ROSI|nr:ABC transporter-like protein [Corchorus olitorius]
MASLESSLAYVSQTSWIQSGTIRDNILYGKPMEEERYRRAIKSCALDKDIDNFDHGDLTEIGQRGINMSGGQKQRIQLARAVYNDADIYLLDDPFSAVDAQTAAVLFNDCVMDALGKKTVILVTHQVEFLSEVDKILFMSIPAEAPETLDDKIPPSSWPSEGKIELQELKIRYRPNAPLVLKGITCTFMGGTRVGVVGRTGSGKSTLISSLFRLVEPATGKILIDGLDICSIGLKDLRMKLSIIPQDPTLFKGSVRTNLDPLGLYSDEEIWQALEKCQLKATISSLPNKLDSSGRVLLKRNKILVLDEATASIDSATDATLQRIIRQEFTGCTVITVAHRVPTVIDSDMVMVLSYGELMEYDEPAKLMETNSFFSKLVAEYWYFSEIFVGLTVSDEGKLLEYDEPSGDKFFLF